MKTNLKTDNLEFIDFPRQLSICEYDKNESRFVDYFQCHPAVAAVYKIGGVNDPGISDLDLILVLKKKGVLERRDYEFISEADGYVFAHRPFVIPENLFPWIHYYFYPSGLQNLTGENYTFFQPVADTERKQLTWFVCTEAALSRLCDIVFQTTCKSSISVRKMLLKLNSIKHNIDLVQKLDETIVNAEQRGFISQISDLRKSWFSLHKEVQVTEMLKAIYKGITILLEINDHLALLSRDVFNLSLGDQIEAYSLFPNSLQILKFKPKAKAGITTNRNPFRFLEKISKNYRSKIVRHVNDISIITLPCELMYLFLPINPKASLTAKAMKRNLIIRDESKSLQCAKGNDSTLILERFQLIDEYNDFIRIDKFSMMSFLLMAPWLTNRKAKFYYLKNMILKIMLKLRLI